LNVDSVEKSDRLHLPHGNDGADKRRRF